MRKLVALLILFSFAKSSLAQRVRPQNKQEMIAVCNRFMQAFKSGKYFEAYDSLKAYTVVEDYKLDTIALTSINQMKALADSYGKSLSVEQISEKPVKNCLIKLIYLLKFERSWLKFRFILYNSGSGWTITSFTYNDEPDDLFN
jgi:hypothetical protein